MIKDRIYIMNANNSVITLDNNQFGSKIAENKAGLSLGFEIFIGCAILLFIIIIILYLISKRRK